MRNGIGIPAIRGTRTPDIMPTAGALLPVSGVMIKRAVSGSIRNLSGTRVVQTVRCAHTYLVKLRYHRTGGDSGAGRQKKAEGPHPNGRGLFVISSC